MSSLPPTDEMSPSAASPRRPWFHYVAAIAVGFLSVVVLLVLLLPSVVASTGLLQRLLNGQLAAHGIRASIGKSELGWLTPTAFRDVRIDEAEDRWSFSAAELGSELSLWQMLTSPGDLGTFLIDQPTIVVTVDESLERSALPTDGAVPTPAPSSPTSKSTSSQRFAVRLRNGTILVRVPGQEQPLEFARQINLQADWQQTAAGRVLTVAPGRPLEDVQLSQEMCETGLKFVAPILGDATWVRGSLSVELDQCRIPLDQPADADVKGRVTLNAVETGLKSPLAIDIAKVLAKVTQRDLPDVIRLADNCVVEFAVREGSVRHDGFAFGLPAVNPDLVIRTEGTVSFGGDLDLLASIPLPLQMLGDGPLAQALGNQTLRLPIRGTLEEPQLNLEGDGQVASDLISNLLDPVVSGDVTAEDIFNALRGIRQQRQESREESAPLFPRLRDRLRNRRDDTGR